MVISKDMRHIMFNFFFTFVTKKNSTKNHRSVANTKSSNNCSIALLNANGMPLKKIH